MSTFTAPVMGATNLLFEAESDPQPGYFTATASFGGLTRTEKLARLKALEDAGYNQAMPIVSKAPARDELVDAVAAATPEDLASLPPDTLDFIGNHLAEVKLLAFVEKMTDVALDKFLAGLSADERDELIQIAARHT